MTNPLDSQRLESYVPVYDAIPDKWEEARSFTVEQLKKISEGVNIREIGWYLDEELLTGKAFIPGINNALDGSTSQQFRSILRKVIDFGTLPNAGTKFVAHEIVVDNNFTLIQIWASATKPTAPFAAIPIPYVSTTFTEDVELSMDDTNIIIRTLSNRSTFTRCFVVVEYIQEL